MKNFEIIEEGRLNKSEMGTIMGGNLVNCPGGESNKYDTGKCLKDGTVYSSCPVGYKSCTSTALVSCGSSYVGPTGPAGDGAVNPTNCSSDPLVAYAGNIAGEIFDGPSSAEVC